MNVFIVGSPLETAMCLDPRRLNKQIIECKQILKAIDGETKAWLNHPSVKQYTKDIYCAWLRTYLFCLEYYKTGKYDVAKVLSDYADVIRPDWHTTRYLTQMKRRLYTKNNNYYSQWKHLGESDINMYYVENEWRYYRNGKQIKNEDVPISI